MEEYLRPAGIHRIEIVVAKSRFITHINQAETPEAAREFISYVSDMMPDASHHVYAFRVGHANSIIEGMSDAGEPTGTAGPPTLSCLRGADLGDIVLVTTRYFGGTKLGTGGLVRTYTEAAQLALKSVPTELKVEISNFAIELPYSYFTPLKRLIEEYEGIIDNETFEVQVTLYVRLLTKRIPEFKKDLADLSNGTVDIVLL